MAETWVPFAIAGGLVAVSLVGVVIAVMLFRVTPGPNEIVILSGRKFQAPDGTVRGYRVAYGPTLRLPVIEVAATMSTERRPVTARISAAYSKGGLPISLSLNAWIGIARHEPDVHNAVERFLGRDSDDIARVARETLEGATRGIVATLEPEQIASDPQRVIETIIEDVHHDMSALGLVIDSMVIVGEDEADRKQLDGKLAALGIESLAAATEIRCDVSRERQAASAEIADGAFSEPSGELPPIEPRVLQDIGRARVTCKDGTAIVRWPTAPVSERQLVAGGKLLAALRDAGAYR